MTNRSNVMGFTRQKNKVSKNAFDLSYRHMFTADIGELLPICCQWVNPNESFKIGYDGFARTAPLQTAAFTRLRENVQYYFVPFQALWRHFPEVYMNMPVGDNGQNISKIASSSTEAFALSTSLPYISYRSISTYLTYIYNTLVSALDDFFTYKTSVSDRTAANFYKYCTFGLAAGDNSDAYLGKVFFGNGYRLCRAAKLLMALGYGNFSLIAQYDAFAMAMQFITDNGSWDVDGFTDSNYALSVNTFENVSATNVPNLSVFPLLAYHKICQDNYKYRQWQSFEPWTCNIDYLKPTDSLNAVDWLSTSSVTSTNTSIFDLEQSNLPLDYLLGVLPKAQYGDESVVSLNSDLKITGSGSAVTDSKAAFTAANIHAKTASGTVQSGSLSANSSSGNVYVGSNLGSFTVDQAHSHSYSGSTVASLLSINGSDLSFSISALRSARALQKYKEIQNSNDPDFVDQVLAHFGIKPHVDDRNSRYIGGSDATIQINPQVNANLEGDNTADIKAIGSSQLNARMKFTADVPGLIIGIYRCTPQLDYANVGIDRNLLKTDVTDFPMPEFDSIGMQTQYRFEIAAPCVGTNHILGDPDTSYHSVDMSLTYGYSPRYAELKTSFDRFEGGFLGTYSTWVTGLTTDYLRKWYYGAIDKTAGSLHNISELLQCHQDLCYPIFVNQWSGTVNDDKILIGSVNTIQAVRPFSIHGLPWSN